MGSWQELIKVHLCTRTYTKWRIVHTSILWNYHDIISFYHLNSPFYVTWWNGIDSWQDLMLVPVPMHANSISYQDKWERALVGLYAYRKRRVDLFQLGGKKEAKFQFLVRDVILFIGMCYKTESVKRFLNFFLKTHSEPLTVWKDSYGSENDFDITEIFEIVVRTSLSHSVQYERGLNLIFMLS